MKPRYTRLTAIEEEPIQMRLPRESRKFNKIRERGKMISKIEDGNLDYYCRAEKKIAEMRKKGEPVDTSILFSSGKKQRYLQALRSYDCIGLTAKELHEKRYCWLYQPGEEEDFRLKTISMFLSRLYKKGLASRRRCDWSKAYRYYITENGEKKLAYYEKASYINMDFLTKKRNTQNNRTVLENIKFDTFLITQRITKNNQYTTKYYALYKDYTHYLFQKIIEFQEAFLEEDKEKTLSIIDETTKTLNNFNLLQKASLIQDLK